MDKNDNKIRMSVLLLIAAGVVAFLLVVLAYWWKIPGPISSDEQLWANFGDYVGGVLSPIFGLLTLIAVLMAFRLQHKELVETSKALTASNNTMSNQKALLEKQNFETTFFRMLALHNEILNSLEYDAGYKHGGNQTPGAWNPVLERDLRKGRLAVQALVEILVETVNMNLPTEEEEDLGSVSDEDLLVQVNDNYMAFWLKYQYLVRPWLDYLESIFEMLRQSNVVEKRFYAGILRTQFTVHELLILFFHGISDAGRNGFKEELNRYAIFRSLNIDKHGNTFIRLAGQYSDSAFNEFIQS